jgi:hypothetical protein
MTLTAVKPGGWDVEEVLTSDQMNALQVELLKAIDGEGGGTYTLTAPLVLDGEAVQFAATATVLDGAALELDDGATLVANDGAAIEVADGAELNVEDGGELNVRDGGRIDVEDGAGLHLDAGSECDIDTDVDLAAAATLVLHGTINALSGAEVNLQSGAALHAFDGSLVTLDGTVNMSASGELNLASGADIVGADGAQIQVYDAEDLLINNSSVAFRLTMMPFFIEEGTPGTPDWVAEVGGTWLMSTASGGRILFPLPLRVGDVITSLSMTINGSAGPGANHGTHPTDKPAIELIKVSASGVTTSIQTAVDPVTGASYGSAHAVTLSGGLFPYTVTSDVHYVRVLAEGPTGGIANATRLCSIDGTLTAKSFRGQSEVY